MWSYPCLITRFMGPIWGSPGADRTQVGPVLAPWTLLSGLFLVSCSGGDLGMPLLSHCPPWSRHGSLWWAETVPTWHLWCCKWQGLVMEKIFMVQDPFHSEHFTNDLNLVDIFFWGVLYFHYHFKYLISDDIIQFLVPMLSIVWCYTDDAENISFFKVTKVFILWWSILDAHTAINIIYAT